MRELHPARIVAAIVLTFLSALAVTEAAAQSGTGVTVARAPVRLYPDVNRTPLSTLPPGTSVQVLENKGDWIRISFRDQTYGDRVGFVQAEHLKIGPQSQPAPPAPEVRAVEPRPTESAALASTPATPSRPEAVRKTPSVASRVTTSSACVRDPQTTWNFAPAGKWSRNSVVKVSIHAPPPDNQDTRCFSKTQFDGLAPYAGPVRAVGAGREFVLIVPDDVPSGRFAIYANAIEAVFARGECLMTFTLVRPTLLRPFFIGLHPIAQAALGEPYRSASRSLRVGIPQHRQRKPSVLCTCALPSYLTSLTSACSRRRSARS
jgi:hypothetical protein